MAYKFNAISGVFDITGVGGAGGANTALSNLAGVAINTTLVSDTDNTDDLGTAAIGWANLFLSDAAGAPTTNGQISYNTANSRFEFYQNGGVRSLEADTDALVGIDVAATPGFIGAANSDGVLRTAGSDIEYTDGGNFVTLTTRARTFTMALMGG